MNLNSEHPVCFLAQPWFSDSGHPAPCLDVLYCNVKTVVKPRVLVYVNPLAPSQAKWFFNEALKDAVIVTAPRIVQTVLKTLFSGTIATILYLRKQAKIKSLCVFYADVDLCALSLFIFPWPKNLLRLTAMALVGPEHFQGGRIFKGIKWPLVKKVLSHPKFHLCLRTPQLAEAWKMAFPKSKARIAYVPSIELVGRHPPPCTQKSPTSRSRQFVIAGQIRPEKSIKILASVFRKNPDLGRLSIIGSIIDTNLKSGLQVQMDVLNVQDRVLTDAELISFLSASDYNLMLYHPWDNRMESAMLFTSIAAGCPVICFEGGWLGEQVVAHGLGWTTSCAKQNSLENFLASCPHPSSGEYQGVKAKIFQCFTEWSDPSRVKIFAETVGWNINQRFGQRCETEDKK